MSDPGATPRKALDPRAIAAFEAEAAQRGLDLAKYDFEYEEDDYTYLVFTLAKSRTPGQRGSGVDPEIEVKISKATFAVVSSHDVK